MTELQPLSYSPDLVTGCVGIRLDLEILSGTIHSGNQLIKCSGFIHNRL